MKAVKGVAYFCCWDKDLCGEYDMKSGGSFKLNIINKQNDNYLNESITLTLWDRPYSLAEENGLLRAGNSRIQERGKAGL